MIISLVSNQNNLLNGGFLFGAAMKLYSIKVTQCRDAYLSIEAESEAEARDEVFGRDEETFDWENHDLKIESVDEQEPYDEPSL
jgi:hypothetical protein